MSAGAGEARLRIRPLLPVATWEKGESIAVNGACLTVETFDAESFTAYASAETLSRTNLGALSRGSEVNLERALRLGDRLGGHLVSGHVDCLCELLSISASGSSRLCRFRCPPEQARYITVKGSVAVDGISLTVNDRGRDFFTTNVIPATWEAATAGDWKPGRRINLETDLLSKYVEQLLAPRPEEEKKTPLNLEFFQEYGY
jgi:riboflavin synthase